MKRVIYSSFMLFTVSFFYAQTSVKPSVISIGSEDTNTSAQIEALVKQNSLLKKQLAAMLNPSQAELNSLFIKNMEESNKILSTYFKKEVPVVASSPKFSASRVVGDLVRKSKEITGLNLFTNSGRAYISVSNEALFNDNAPSETATKLVKLIADYLNENADYALTIQRNEIASTNAKKESLANEKLAQLVEQAKKQLKNHTERISVSQFSSIGKDNDKLNPDNYHFVISY